MIERYRCDICGAEFDDPVRDSWTEDMDGEGAFYEWTTCVCPNCGSEEIYECEEDEDEDA